MDEQAMREVIRQRQIGRGSLPRGTEVRAEAGTGFAWFGLPFAMLHVAVEWDGCLWHATPGTAWVYWHNDRAASREDAAIAAGVITPRETAGGVRQAAARRPGTRRAGAGAAR